MDPDTCITNTGTDLKCHYGRGGGDILKYFATITLFEIYGYLTLWFDQSFWSKE